MQLVDYEKYIVENNFVDSSKSSYYSAWVKKFLNLNLSNQLNIEEKVRQFVQSLSTDNSLQSWQLDQARHAVELYLGMFIQNTACPESENIPSEFLDIQNEMLTVLRLKHYSYRTEQTYMDWCKRYYKYCFQEKLDFKNSESVKIYLTYLAVNRGVASATQNQAFNSILFMFKYVLKNELDDIKGTVRAKRKRNLPAVLSVDEIKLLFKQVDGLKRMMLELIYGTGLRVSEFVRLRVKDIDFDNDLVIIIDGKGGKDRAVSLPRTLKKQLEAHLIKVKELHYDDLLAGYGEVYLPEALSRKYSNTAKEWKWQYVFPAGKLSVDPRSGKVRRHHILDKTVQNIMKQAVVKSGIPKKASVHTLRHSYATHLLMNGVNIRQIQELLGHKSLETTMIYTHILKDLSTQPESPLDML
jgi:integron integrase